MAESLADIQAPAGLGALRKKDAALRATPSLRAVVPALTETSTLPAGGPSPTDPTA